MKTLSAILIDLDGTLTDPAPGIIGCFRHALQCLGQEAPQPETLDWIIGPPLRESFGRLLPAHSLSETINPEEGLRLYRERYGVSGMLEATLYAGVETMLEQLLQIAPRLILCTSKPHVYARPILQHFGLARFFDGVYGAELDGTHDDKGDLIAHILAQEALAPTTLCMIGDRKHDVLGAARHGIPTIGALWGFGGEAELRAAGVAALCKIPVQVPPAMRILCDA